MYLLQNLIKNKNLLKKNININFNLSKSCIFIKGSYGLVYYKLSNLYFYKLINNKLIFIFLNIKCFLNFVKHFNSLYKNVIYIYSIRLKMKGLGYRIRKISKNLYYFFFNYTNMYYFHIPFNILLKWYKKKVIFLGSNFFILKLLFSNILMLKKIGPYRLRGLRYPRQIIFIKKGGKKK